MVSEEWRPIPGYIGYYEASNLGRVRRSRGGDNTWNGRVLKQSFDKDGYLLVTPCKRGRQETCKVHRLIAGTWLGRCPKNKQINHRDGDKTNNRIENLEYVSASENIRHAVRSGLRVAAKGGKHYHTKLSEHAASMILFFSRWKFYSHPVIAKLYGTTTATVSNISRRHTWKHL